MYDMNTLLENYEPGRPENKPLLLEQIKKLEEDRNKRIQEHNKMLQQQMLNNNMKSIDSLRDEYEKKLSEKNILINELLKKVKQLTNEVNELRNIIDSTK
jgi:radical SAM superfamily enzyme